MSDLLPFATAFLLGLVRAIDADHAVAVSTFVSGRPALPLAFQFGFRWALGHSIAVIVAGGVLLASGLTLSPQFGDWAERIVGVMLIGIGIWSLRTLRNLHVHGPDAHADQARLHLHPAGPGHAGAGAPRHASQHNHPRGVLLVGLIHGLAGTTGAVALVPIALMPDWRAGLLYLLIFCLGVMGGMTAFALVLAQAIRTATSGSLAWGRRIAALVATLSIVTGIVWLWPSA